MQKGKFFDEAIAEFFDANYEKMADAEMMSAMNCMEIEMAKEMEMGMFVMAVMCESIPDKDTEMDIASEPEICYIEYSATKANSHSEKAKHRRHRAGCRKAKAKAKREVYGDSHWRHYYNGTAKLCKKANHRAVRREYGIPNCKGNCSHKVASYEYPW